MDSFGGDGHLKAFAIASTELLLPRCPLRHYRFGLFHQSSYPAKMIMVSRKSPLHWVFRTR